jgi:hypothetical protein
MMKTKTFFLLVIFLSASAICLLNSCDEECAPCDICPPDPASRFVGVWIIFESYVDGIPGDMSVGETWDFRASDTLFWFRESSTDTVFWFAKDEQLILYQEYPPGIFVSDYYFEADTLDVSFLMADIPIRLRMLEEENMPQP